MLVTLLIISGIMLIVYWGKGRNAVWGGATIGVVVGIIISLIWKNWSLLGWSFAVGTLSGVGSELLAWGGNKLKQSMKRKEQLELLEEGLKTGKAKQVYKVFIRDPWVGIKEDYWELSEEQVEEFVDEEGIAYANCHYEEGQPKYTFVTKMLWEKWDKVEEIMLNSTLSPQERTQAIKKLIKG